MANTIKPSRTGDQVTATWTADAKYKYIWCACTAVDYEKWVAVRSESWEDPILEWSGVPANATLALMAPKMRGEQRVWMTLATAKI